MTEENFWLGRKEIKQIKQIFNVPKNKLEHKNQMTAYPSHQEVEETPQTHRNCK